LAVDRVAVVAPPVAFTAYDEPAPTTKRSRKSGVPLEPLHNAQPEGIEAIDPDHNIIIPVINGGEDIHVVPLDVSTFPEAPGATKVGGEDVHVVPLDVSTLPAVLGATN